MRFAVLPAAGRSIRMGRPKLSLPLGGRTILEHVVAALQQADIEHILVVVGPHIPELAKLAQTAGADVCQLAEETADMRATVEAGLRWLRNRFQPGTHDSWLLVPPDHPALSTVVVRRLAQARLIQPTYSIFVPTFRGRRGHPVLLAWSHVERLRGHPADQGLNTYIRSLEAEVLEVGVDTEAILWDLDTPEEYERLQRGWPAEQ